MPQESELLHERSTYLFDLDDACLLRILRLVQPQPQRAALTCRRFAHLKSPWLIVCAAGTRLADAPCGSAAGGPVYSTLQAAVQASRPGDTIWLAPGAPHAVSATSIPWPLHLLGGGGRPDDVRLVAPRGADAALVCAAAAKLTNLTIVAMRAPCVLHRRGRLHIERCQLLCDCQGLPHLMAPLVTVASSAPPSRASSPMPGAKDGAAAAAPCTPALPLRSAAGAGRLTVAECRLMGGSTAVQCCGTGGLDAVRVVYEAHAAFFYLEVDSSWPGTALRAVPAFLAEPPERATAPKLAPAAQRRKLGLPLPALPAAFAARLPVAVKPEPRSDCSGLGTGAATSTGGGARNALHGRLPPLPPGRHADSGTRAVAGEEEVQGLQRIEQLLGKRSISPAMLLEHLQARSRQRHA